MMLDLVVLVPQPPVSRPHPIQTIKTQSNCAHQKKKQPFSNGLNHRTLEMKLRMLHVIVSLSSLIFASSASRHLIGSE